MPIKLKQSTASQEIPLGVFVDATDGFTAETGLTIANTDIKIWKSGATTLANKNSGGATHIAGGIYYAVLDATDTDTLGPMVIFVHVAGARPVSLMCEVISATAYNALISDVGDFLDSIETGVGLARTAAERIAAMVLVTENTIGATGNDTTHLHLDALTYGNDEINNCLLVIRDVSESEYHARWIDDWVAATKLATVETLPFTPQNSTDTYWVLSIRRDVNLKKVNDVALTGDGDATPWGPA